MSVCGGVWLYQQQEYQRDDRSCYNYQENSRCVGPPIFDVITNRVGITGAAGGGITTPLVACTMDGTTSSSDESEEYYDDDFVEAEVVAWTSVEEKEPRCTGSTPSGGTVGTATIYDSNDNCNNNNINNNDNNNNNGNRWCKECTLAKVSAKSLLRTIADTNTNSNTNKNINNDSLLPPLHSEETKRINERSRRNRKTKRAKKDNMCVWCGCVKTAEWRKGPSQICLCNACGLQYRVGLRNERNRISREEDIENRRHNK